MAYAVSMAVWANSRAALDLCSHIDVNIRGEQHADSVTRQGILAELNRYPGKIIGVPSHTVNTLGIENYLKSFSNFEDVECTMSSHGHLVVSVLPMIPEIRIFDGQKSYYVNKDGKRIASNAEFFSDVPVVSGRFNNRLRPEYVLPVTRFIARDSLLHQLVGMVVVRDKDNIILVPRIDGHVINFGDTSRLLQKKKALLTAYHDILPYRGWNTYDTISVKFKGMVVATRRNKALLHPNLPIQEDEDPEEGSLPVENISVQETQPQQASTP